MQTRKNSVFGHFSRSEYRSFEIPYSHPELIQMFNFFFVNFSKNKTSPILLWVLMTIILGWFLYLKIACIVESLILSKRGLLFEYLVMSRFCTVWKKSHRISAVSRSVLISYFTILSQKNFALIHNLSDKKCFTVF